MLLPTLLPLLAKPLLLLAKLQPLLAKLLVLLRLPLLPSNTGSGTKNRPSGRFFFACNLWLRAYARKRSRRATASISRGSGCV